MRVLKIVLACLVLHSPVFFAASDGSRPAESRPEASEKAIGERQIRLPRPSESGTGIRDRRSERKNGVNPLPRVSPTAPAALSWNTFIGTSADDSANGLTLDSEGNIFVVGCGCSAVNDDGDRDEIDAFVAKLDSKGNQLWRTLIGGDLYDEGIDIALDSPGNIYIIGTTSYDSWGSPIRAHSRNNDAFVAKLDAAGNLIWNTFLGGDGGDEGRGIAVDPIGNAYVTGNTYHISWGSPIRSFNPRGGDCSINYPCDAFIAKLDAAGNLIWNTFLGGDSEDIGRGLALDSAGNVFVTGDSDESWGSPIREFADDDSAFVAKLNPQGNLLWNTFLGDMGNGLVVNADGNIFVTGYARESDSMRGCDAFVAKLDGDGALQWNSLLGGFRHDKGQGIAVDPIGNIYLTGSSLESWGTPVRAFSAKYDAFAAKLDADGRLQWNAFLGGTDDDYGLGIAVGPIGNIYVAGGSMSRWGSPIHPGAGGFVAKIRDQYELTVSAGSHGTTAPPPGEYFFNLGVSANVSALPDAEYVFDKWTGDVPADLRSSPSVSILMNKDKSIQANFRPVNPPADLKAIRLTNRSLIRTEYIIDLFWSAHPANEGLSLAAYRVYRKDGVFWTPIAELPSATFSWRIRNVTEAEQTYGVCTVTAGGVESAKAEIVK